MVFFFSFLKAMAAAANYAWVNRSSMTFLCRQAFAKQFNASPDDLDMHVVYDGLEVVIVVNQSYKRRDSQQRYTSLYSQGRRAVYRDWKGP